MKNAIILVLFIIGIALTSCKSAIPERDGIGPKITFLIVPAEDNKGDNISIPSDFDFDNKVLYLKNYKTYVVLAVTKDQADPLTMGGEEIKGSISRARFTVPANNLIRISNFPEDLPPNWTSISSGGIDSSTQTFSFRADAMNIKDGTGISPKMTPLELTRGDEFEFIFTAEDHHENDVTKILKVRVTNNDAYIGDL